MSTLIYILEWMGRHYALVTTLALIAYGVLRMARSGAITIKGPEFHWKPRDKPR